MSPGKLTPRAHARRIEARKYRVSKQTVTYVEMTLFWHWSPEQVSGVSKFIGLPVLPPCGGVASSTKHFSRAIKVSQKQQQQTLSHSRAALDHR